MNCLNGSWSGRIYRRRRGCYRSLCSRKEGLLCLVIPEWSNQSVHLGLLTDCSHPSTCGSYMEHEYFWISFVVYVVIFVAVVVAIELWKRK